MAKVRVDFDLDPIQAFSLLCQTLHVKFNEDDVPNFFINDEGEISCNVDDRGELYLAMYHLATKICPNTEFRNLFEDPNTLMCKLYKEVDEIK